MKRCLIVCHGYFGDHMFASSIAKHLKEEKQFDVVDYIIGFPQVLPFFERNQYIDNTMLTSIGPAPMVPQNLQYDKIFKLGPIKREVPPAVEMQLLCGVRNPSPMFEIHTDPELDAYVKSEFDEVRSKTDLPVLAIMQGWKEKTFLFTPEQYNKGIDVPNLGYGGSHRNTDYITSKLAETFPHIMVGAPHGTSQFNTGYEGPSLDLTASLLKLCDYFVGAEGGLANLAYAVGTKTILTSDFVHQLYGPNGVLQKLKEPKLGPRHYSANKDEHVDLNPYLTDNEVVDTIINIVSSKKGK